MLPNSVQDWIAWFTAQPPTIDKPEWEGKIEAVVEQGKIWQVWYKAQTWYAHSATSVELHPGDWVKVVGQKDPTLLIEPLDNSLK